MIKAGKCYLRTGDEEDEKFASLGGEQDFFLECEEEIVDLSGYDEITLEDNSSLSLCESDAT